MLPPHLEKRSNKMYSLFTEQQISVVILQEKKKKKTQKTKQIFLIATFR